MSIQREARIEFVMKRLEQAAKECGDLVFSRPDVWWSTDFLRQLACAAILAVMDFESEERAENVRRRWHEC